MYKYKNAGKIAVRKINLTAQTFTASAVFVDEKDLFVIVPDEFRIGNCNVTLLRERQIKRGKSGEVINIGTPPSEPEDREDDPRWTPREFRRA